MPAGGLGTAALIGGGAKLLSGIVGGIFGLGQKRKAKKLLAANPRPTYDIPQEAFQNKGIAEQLSASGLPSTQYAQAQQNIQRQQAGALQAAQTRRGGLGLIGNIQQRTNDATLGLDATNAKMRVQNMQGLMNANTQLAGYRDKAFNINKLQPYQENTAYARSLQAAGTQNLMGGIDSAIGGFATGLGGGNFKALFGGGKKKAAIAGGNNDYFGLNSGTDY